MANLSLFWVSPNKDKHLSTIENDFLQRIYRAIKTEQFTLSPISNVAIKLEKMTIDNNFSIKEISSVLIHDASLSALVIRAANRPISKQKMPCYDLNLAISHLGIEQVQAIAAIQNTSQLKISSQLNKQCHYILNKSAQLTREFGATMALLCKKLKHYDEQYKYLDVKKSLLIGLLANIGIYSAVSIYKKYCAEGNYLNFEIATHVFENISKDASQFILKYWGFDIDFIEVSLNKKIKPSHNQISYFDIATMANHLLMFRNKDNNIKKHDIELTLAQAEVMYELTNLTEQEFRHQLDDILI